jgi:hypothetical protein
VSVSELLVSAASLEKKISAEVSLNTAAGEKEGRRRYVAKRTASYLRALAPIAALIPEPVTAASAASAIGVTASALDAAGAPAERNTNKQTPDITVPEEVDVILVVLDDLDRCSPQEAWRFLQGARWIFHDPSFLTILVCDPSVLGHHVASALGVSAVDGVGAISKYIDVPIRVPRSVPGEPGPHLEAVEAVLESWPALGWPLKLVAWQHTGPVPVRDVLVSLPQAAIWLSTLTGVDKPNPDEGGKYPDYALAVSDWVLAMSLVHTCLPSAFDVLVAIAGRQGDAEAYQAAVTLLKGDFDTHTENQFGASVISTLNSRTGSVRHLAGRAGYRCLGPRRAILSRRRCSATFSARRYGITGSSSRDSLLGGEGRRLSASRGLRGGHPESRTRKEPVLENRHERSRAYMPLSPPPRKKNDKQYFVRSGSCPSQGKEGR